MTSCNTESDGQTDCARYRAGETDQASQVTLMNPNFWLKSWKIKHIDLFTLEWQLPQWPCPGHWASSCSELQLTCCSSRSGLRFLRPAELPLGETVLLAWVSRLESHVAHPSSSSFFFKEWQLVINIGILDLKLCGPAADSHRGGYSQDVESWTALNWAFSYSVNLLQLLYCECLHSCVYIAYNTGLIWELFIILMERRERHWSSHHLFYLHTKRI